MIIVNQDKDMIINFDNVVKIFVKKYCDDKPEIYCRTIHDIEVFLGEYQTEERAKEVLQEIIKLYGADIWTVPVYQMPEE